MARGMAKEKAQITKRREQVAAMYLRGHSQCAIGESLGVAQQTVSSDLKAIQAAWIESYITDIAQHKAKELHRIDELERTYYEAWERSRQPKRTSTQEAQTGEGDQAAKMEATKARITEEQRDGNPNYLAGVERCIAMRCKLLGLNAEADRISLTSSGAKDGGNLLFTIGKFEAAFQATADRSNDSQLCGNSPQQPVDSAKLS